ncbi:MAG: DMT family transporter [Geminicoccaceae bacterium]|nr:DMT family transporter [Geminicoccaceae bacterium]
MPALFVVLWSTGFIGAKLGLPDSEPMTFLAIRFAIAAVVLAVAAWFSGASWPRDMFEAARYALIGLFVHGVYLGGVFASIAHGVEAGASALIVSLQPLLVATMGGLLLGERSTGRQWGGLVLGVIGVTLTVGDKLSTGIGSPFGVLLAVIALIGMTIGTLLQKRYGQGMDLRSGSAIQFAAAMLFCGLLAAMFENGHVHWTPKFAFALAWLVLVLSFGAISLLYLLIRRGEATRVSSLFFLVPSSTALIAWLLFDERMTGLSLVGMVLTMVAVALVSLPHRGGGRWLGAVGR